MEGKVASLKNDLKDKKPVLGLEVNLKKIRGNNLKTIYLANNCPKKESVKKLAITSKTEVVELDENSKELGVLCKKPFAIAAVGFE